MSDGPRCSAAQSNNPDGTFRQDAKGLYPIWCAREAGHKGWHGSKDGFGWPPAPASESKPADGSLDLRPKPCEFMLSRHKRSVNDEQADHYPSA